ncbi:basic proline-rich protein-like [Trichosurus vulpecula]|uniref:basic proline-rich protein-like n=1 Tax=Trichosurus vulpecula TaxID=9337 RepID=UPI00186B01A7|nr:basic proline-rich protein-like [Trichosurus vulpecula]
MKNIELKTVSNEDQLKELGTLSLASLQLITNSSVSGATFEHSLTSKDLHPNPNPPTYYQFDSLAPSRRNAPRGLSSPGWRGRSPDAGQGGAGRQQGSSPAGRPPGFVCGVCEPAAGGSVCPSARVRTAAVDEGSWPPGDARSQARRQPARGAAGLLGLLPPPPYGDLPGSGRQREKAPAAGPTSSGRLPGSAGCGRSFPGGGSGAAAGEGAPASRPLALALHSHLWGAPGRGAPPTPRSAARSRPSGEKQTFPSHPRPPAKGWVWRARETRGWPRAGVAGLRLRSAGKEPRAAAAAHPLLRARSSHCAGSGVRSPRQPPARSHPRGAPPSPGSGDRASARGRPRLLPPPAKPPGAEPVTKQLAGRMAASPTPPPPRAHARPRRGPSPGPERSAPREPAAGAKRAGAARPPPQSPRAGPPAASFHTPRGEQRSRARPAERLRGSSAGAVGWLARAGDPSVPPLASPSLVLPHAHARPGADPRQPEARPRTWNAEPGARHVRSPLGPACPAPASAARGLRAPRPLPWPPGARHARVGVRVCVCACGHIRPEPNLQGATRGRRRGRSAAAPDPTPAASRAPPSRSRAAQPRRKVRLWAATYSSDPGSPRTGRPCSHSAPPPPPPPRRCRRSGSRACSPPLPSMNGGEGMQRGAPREPEPRSDFPGRALPARTHAHSLTLAPQPRPPGEEPPRRRQPLGGAPTSARLGRRRAEPAGQRRLKRAMPTKTRSRPP